MAKRYGMAIDMERCTGCQTCTVACKVENKMESVSGIRVETLGGGHTDTPSGAYPDLVMQYRPVPCMHCDDPPCMAACAVDAITKRGDGIVILDWKKCDGCQACVPACPYGAIGIDDEGGVIARKCNLCFERLDEGYEPFCALCCGNDAILWGDLDDPESPVARMIAERGARALDPEKGTGPAVYYAPPRAPVKK